METGTLHNNAQNDAQSNSWKNIISKILLPYLYYVIVRKLPKNPIKAEVIFRNSF